MVKGEEGIKPADQVGPSGLHAALADPEAPVPPGARRMTQDEREAQVNMVFMALTKQASPHGLPPSPRRAAATAGIPGSASPAPPRSRHLRAVKKLDGNCAELERVGDLWPPSPSNPALAHHAAVCRVLTLPPPHISAFPMRSQGFKGEELPAAQQAALLAYITTGTPCELEVKTKKGFVACTLANITNAGSSAEPAGQSSARNVPGKLVPEG